MGIVFIAEEYEQDYFLAVHDEFGSDQSVTLSLHDMDKGVRVDAVIDKRVLRRLCLELSNKFKEDGHRPTKLGQNNGAGWNVEWYSDCDID
jgi:hypothetical protein